MSGVSVIWQLATRTGPLTAQVPKERIKSGILPINTTLPAIGITQLSSTRQNTTGMNEARTLVTERVQVTVIVTRTWAADGYPKLVQLMTLLRQACPNTVGTVGGITVHGVLPDVEGPDLEDEALGQMARSQDFIVYWSEARFAS